MTNLIFTSSYIHVAVTNFCKNGPVFGPSCMDKVKYVTVGVKSQSTHYRLSCISLRHQYFLLILKIHVKLINKPHFETD